MKKNNLILYGTILILGLIAPFIFPGFKLQISFLWILIVLAMTWDVQGGQMGYNTFGNILFFGVGMYLCASVQIGMFAMRFGIIQIRKYKQGKTKVKKKSLEQIAFGIFFIIILGLIIYSINDLLFN